VEVSWGEVRALRGPFGDEVGGFEVDIFDRFCQIYLAEDERSGVNEVRCRCVVVGRSFGVGDTNVEELGDERA